MKPGIEFLIVDDDELIRVVMRIALERAGHRVLTAADAGDALRLAAEHLPDAVVCDYRLAGTCGLDVLAEIEARALAARRRVPAMILVTGEERSAWPYPRLRKPFDVADLLSLVMRLLDRCGTAAAGR